MTAGCRPQPWADQSTTTPMPATLAAPTGTCHGSGAASGAPAASRYWTASTVKPTLASPPDDVACGDSLPPPMHASTHQRAYTWYGALPGAGVAAPHADCHQPATWS